MKENNLKYKVIKSDVQYEEYCLILERLLENPDYEQSYQDEVELLTLLIEIWDDEHNDFTSIDPVVLLRALMMEHGMKAADLTRILNVSKGLVSDILNYKKGMSKDVIRILADHFKVSQEAFNRPYLLKGKPERKVKNMIKLMVF